MLRGMTELPTPPEEAMCRQCETIKPTGEFYIDTYNPRFLRQPCRECHRTRRRKEYAEKRGIDQSYAYVLKNKYGITLEEYNQKVREQGNRCAVCRRPETVKGTKDGKPRRLAVDHDHATGTVRGLLCLRCNSIVWALEDNHTTLPAIQAYINAHRSKL